MPSPLPLTEISLCAYVSFLAKDGVKYQSIKSYLSALRFLQISAGLPEPYVSSSWPRLEYVLKGIKKPLGTEQGIKPRLPITPDILRRIHTAWQPRAQDADITMLWAAFCLGFFGFLRAGEFTITNDNSFDPHVNLSVGDIAIDSHLKPSLMRITLKASKTDPFRHGVQIFIGHTGNELCPVTAMLRYVAIRGNSPGQLFQFADGRPLTRQRLVDQLRKVLREVNIDCSAYCGHSFRIGAATAAAARGIQDATIKMLGRWESSAYQRYIQTPREELSAISRVLACSNRD